METYINQIFISLIIVIIGLVGTLMYYIYKKNRETTELKNDNEVISFHNEKLIENLRAKDELIKTMRK